MIEKQLQGEKVRLHEYTNIRGLTYISYLVFCKSKSSKVRVAIVLHLWMDQTITPPPRSSRQAGQNAVLGRFSTGFGLCGTNVQYWDPKPVFVSIYGAQESIPPGWESIPGLLKKPANKGSAQ
jgi:hypothetical protein